MHSSFFSFPYRMRIQRIMARRYAALVDGRAATDRYRNGIVGGKEICTFETTAFTDVDLAREMSVVRIFVFEVPILCCFAEVGGQFGSFWANQKRPSVYSRRRWVELVAPFPRRGGPGPVLLRQVGRYEHTVLVIGVRLHVRDMTMLVILAIPHLSPGSLEGLRP